MLLDRRVTIYIESVSNPDQNLMSTPNSNDREDTVLSAHTVESAVQEFDCTAQATQSESNGFESQAAEKEQSISTIDSRLPTTRSLVLSTILSLTVVLVLLVVLRFLLPATLEQSRYSWHRGQLKAEYDASGEMLKQVSQSAISDIARLSQTVARRMVPTVVHISTSATDWELGDGVNGTATGHGSGVIIDKSGLILTNSHVLEEGPIIHVLLADERHFVAELLGRDPLTDLAVLKINASGLMAADWGDSDKIQVGAPVWAVGSPFGLTGSITFGIVSSKHRLDLAGTQYGDSRLQRNGKKRGATARYSDLMQTDVAVNPGNSGGPLVNDRGEVIGINTAIIGESYRGVSFAIPSNVAKRISDEIITTGKMNRGWLGVYFRSSLDWEQQQGTDRIINDLGEIQRKRTGVVIHQVLEDSPAAKAGLQFGDLLVAVAGEPVKSVEEAIFWIGNQSPGSVIALTILRDGDQQVIDVTIGDRPEAIE
jgi:S1-C subfamily serine protease